ncbi:MAG: NBR1-Ig-like domain-containing protein [Chloroflexota bacterium]
MKSKLTFASVALLIALLTSLVPVGGLTVQSAAASTYCDAAQFIADVTVPDGTNFAPGTTFKKTWRLKNIGTCTWTTSYSMVYVSGEKMGSTLTVAMPATVAPGQTVDISVDMTAPSAPGKYRGNWQFKNAAGVLFGIGVSANKPWWVEINVTGAGIGVVYNFADKACDAVWTSGAGVLPCPGTSGDANGFVLKQASSILENDVTDPNPGLLVSPQNVTNGYIQGVYPAFRVQAGDRFQATVSCEGGATSCYVAYRLDYQIGSGAVKTFWTFREKYERQYYRANLDLSPLAGQDVKFILYLSAYGSPAGDRALWANPVITRAGAVSTATPTVTGTPPTATPTTTAPTPTHTPPPASGCDKAQFIADVTVPDGSVFNPGTTFKKTWRLKNVGTCTWTTGYLLVFNSGDQMGGPSSAAFPTSVSPGQTVDLSVNLTAPSAGGSYRGYWMLKNASGAIFGIGAQANKPFWVDIKVSGPTVTPGGPTVTPGGPTATPQANTAYDFAANACSAQWVSGAGNLPCPGTDGDAKGFVLKVSNPRLENGATDTRPGLITFPQNVNNGYIQGIYPAFRVQSGDRFQSIVNCEFNATACYVVFRLDYRIGSGAIKTFWVFGEKYEGQYFQADLDLSSLAGQDVQFILTVLAGSYASGDRALWVAPRIFRTGAGAAPTATFTPTFTLTPTVTATSTPTPTATP